MSPPFDGDPAAIAAAVGVLLAALWKVRLWFRHDRRTDLTAEAQHDANDTLIENLRDEVDRLYRLVEELGRRLDTEMSLRRAAEADVARLKIRIEGLERR